MVLFSDMKMETYGMIEDDDWIEPQTPTRASLDALRLSMYGKIQYAHKRVEALKKEFVSLERAIASAQRFTYRHALVKQRLDILKVDRKMIAMARKEEVMRRRDVKDDIDEKRKKLRRSDLSEVIMPHPDYSPFG